MHEVLINCLFKLAQENVWLGELAMTIAVDLGRKATKQTNKQFGHVLTIYMGVEMYLFPNHYLSYIWHELEPFFKIPFALVRWCACEGWYENPPVIRRILI